MKIKRLPIELDAVKWLGTNEQEVSEFCPSGRAIKDEFIIPTLEGAMSARVGDWIVKGTLGEFWPVKPLAFANTYEIVK